MKYRLLIVLCVAGGLYAYVKSDVVGDLVDSVQNSQITSSSGVQDFVREEGRDFYVNRLAEPGQVTVVEFHVSWCSACKKLKNDYKVLTSLRPDVVIRRVKLKDNWNVAWAKQEYGLDIRSTPHVLIFDTEGNIMVQDMGRDKKAFHMLYTWMSTESSQKYRSNR